MKKVPEELKSINIVLLTNLREKYNTIINYERYKRILVKINNKLFKKVKKYDKIKSENLNECNKIFLNKVSNYVEFDVDYSIMPSEFGYDATCIKLFKK